MKKIKTSDLVTILFVISFVAGATYYSSKKRRDLLSLEQSYVIGTVKDKYQPARGDAVMIYNYSIYEMDYDRSARIVKHNVEIGEKYLISVPKGHKEEGIILTDYPVPEGIESPRNGWKRIPKEIEENKLDDE